MLSVKNRTVSKGRRVSRPAAPRRSLASKPQPNPFNRLLKAASLGGKEYKYYDLHQLNDKRVGMLHKIFSTRENKEKLCFALATNFLSFEPILFRHLLQLIRLILQHFFF